MELWSLRDGGVLALLAAPFVLLWLFVFMAVYSGFFVTTRRSPVAESDRLYLDRKSGLWRLRIVDLVLVAGASLACPLAWRGNYRDALAVVCIVLSLLLLRHAHRGFVLLLRLAWENYLYAPDGVPGRARGERYRFLYPTPVVSPDERQQRPTDLDPELIFLYKLVGRTTNWLELREEIGKDRCHRGRRRLLFKTTGKLADPDRCRQYSTEGGVELTPSSVWAHLSEPKLTFHEFAQRWNYYAIMVSRETLRRTGRLLFSPFGHMAAMLVGTSVFMLPGGEGSLTCGVLFGVSFACALVYAGIALLLFIYGKVLALDRLPEPLEEMGDPFFRATSNCAVVIALCTAFTMGVGVPLALSGDRDPTLLGSVLAGLVTANIFFLAVWGTHFSMANTREHAVRKAMNEFSKETSPAGTERLRFRLDELRSLPLWPVKLSVIVKVVLATLFPLVAERLIRLVLG